jgi:hypothetical protein
VYGYENAIAAQQVVGSFFGKLGRFVKKSAMPLLSKGLAFIPGVGPVASMALDAGSKLLRGHPRPRATTPAPARMPQQPYPQPGGRQSSAERSSPSQQQRGAAQPARPGSPGGPVTVIFH